MSRHYDNPKFDAPHNSVQNTWKTRRFETKEKKFMKNVFILPTNKEGNLAYYQESTSYNKPILQLVKNASSDYKNQFIYITNNEEIKKWYIYEGGLLNADESHSKYAMLYGKSVVLTNDPILIAGGVQEIQQSFLSYFAENPVYCVGVDWNIVKDGYELDANSREIEKLKRVYSVNFPQKEHQILTDLKGYFKNTSLEKIQSDWDETKEESPKNLEQIVGEAMFKQADFVYQPKTQVVKLLKEFEILEGITPEQFDEKDWVRFERFCKSRMEEETKKSYTEEQLFQATLEALDLGMQIRQDQLSGWSDKSGKELHKEWFENYIQKLSN